MTATSNDRGGSFRELKRYLPLFDMAPHRHDRGWPHEESDEKAPKRRWKTSGILHFTHHEKDEEEGEPRNGGSA